MTATAHTLVGEAVEMQNERPAVKEMMIGLTRIEIRDDYCVTTPEEIKAILDRIAQQAIGPLTQQEANAQKP